MEVSVIIPVYNAAPYIEKAVLSALSQTETAQVLIINDGSTDQTEAIIKELALQETRITTLHHPIKENRGRAASRNLGIENATQDFIAFLDADDFYNEDRFKNDKKVFKKNPQVDGVYSAIGVFFYREPIGNELNDLRLYSVNKKVPPEELFHTLFYGGEGHFSIDGLTVKRSVFKKAGLFNESLMVAEDTQLIYRLALTSKLSPGVLDKPLAMRGVHDDNIFNDKKLYDTYYLQMYESLIQWCADNGIELSIIDEVLKRLWIIRYKRNEGLLLNIKQWAQIFLINSRLAFSNLSIKYFPLVRRRKEIFHFIYKNR